MAAVNLEEVKKKYNFKQISVATWRNPNVSVLPARGGPKSPLISAEAAGKPFIPSYKVSYKLPQPTDDDESEEEKDQQVEEDFEQPSAEAGDGPVDSPLEPPALSEAGNTVDDQDAEAEDPDEIVEIVEDIAQTDQDLPTHNSGEPDVAEEPRDASEANDGDGREGGAGKSGITQLIEPPLALEETFDAAGSLDDEDAQPPPAPSPPLADIPETEGGDGLPPDLGEPAVIILEPLAEPGSAETTEQGVVNIAISVPDSPSADKSVHFAPGTPDPKHTSRKKKSAKGSKSKSKKRVAVQIDDLPDDIVAIVDEFVGDVPPPAPEPPSGGLDGDGIDQAHDCAEPVVVIVEDSTADAPGAFPTSPILEGGVEPPINIDEPAAVILDPDPTTLAPESGDGDSVVEAKSTESTSESLEPVKPKKKSSKSGGKDKDKKKSSKSKVKDMIKSFEGLDIQLPPPPPMPELDDLLEDLPPPSPLGVTDDVIVEQELTPDDHVVAESEHLLEENAALGPAEGASIPAENPISNVGDVVEAEPDGQNGDDFNPSGGDVIGDAPEETSEEPEAVTVDEPDVQADTGDDEDEAPVVVVLKDGDPETVDEPLVVHESKAAVPDESMFKDLDAPLADDNDQPDEKGKDGEDVQHAANSETSDYVEDQDGTSEAAEEPAAALETPDVPGDLVIETVEEATVKCEAHAPSDEGVAGEPSEPNTSDINEDEPGEVAADKTPQSEAELQQSEENVAESPTEDATAEPPASESDGIEDVGELTKEEEAQPYIVGTESPSDEIAASDELPNEPDVESSPTQDDGVPEEAEQSPIDPLPAEPAAEISPEPPAPEATETAATETEPPNESLFADELYAVEEPPVLPSEEAVDAPAAEPIPEAQEAPENQSLPSETQDIPPETPNAPSEPKPATPPSPTLSKSSSHRHRADHWERKLTSKHASTDAKPEKASSSSKRSSRHSKDEPKSPDRPRRSRRYSTSVDDDAERRRRREARKAEEIAHIEEERRKAEDEELRRIRHEARRAARKAAAEEAAKIAREEAAKVARQEAEAVARKESEARRRRHEEKERETGREKDRTAVRPPRRRRESITQAPLFFRTSSDQPRERRREEGQPRERRRDEHGTRGSRYSERPSSKRSSSPPPPPRPEEVPPSLERSATAPVEAAPAGSSGSKSHHRRRERGDEERPRSSRRESERRERRPTLEEKPRSFFGSLLRRL